MGGGRTIARRIGTSAACVLVLLSAASLPAGETGRVVDVVDGDTLRVRSGRTVRTVRLTGIDAPEKGHPRKPREFLAEESAARLSELCFGQDVRLEGDGEDADAYGRLLRYVYVPASAAAELSPPTAAPSATPGLPALSGAPAPIRRDGAASAASRRREEESSGAKANAPAEILVNLEMVRQGYARVLRAFRFSREPEFLEAELKARRDGKGLWREGGLAELLWLRGGHAAPVEVWPASGNRFAVVFQGLARTDVERRDLPAIVAKILRLRADRADAEFEAESRKAGFRPLGAASAAPRPPDAPTGSTAPYPLVPWEEAGNHAGRKVTVEGRIVLARRERTILFLNFHPNWRRYLTVVVSGRDLRRFPDDAAAYYRGKTVRVSGEIVLHEDRPEIVVRSPGDIEILD